MENALLFSPDPQVRWQQAKEYVNTKTNEELDKEISYRFKDWPRFWWGVANAWLVFLGPSPGNSKAKSINWVEERLPTLGEPHMHFKTQDDSTGFWKRLREWTIEAYKLAGVFDGEEAAMGLTLLANVLETREGDARKIADERLSKAMPNVIKHLELVKPRIIIPMEKRVSKFLVEEFRTSGATIIDGPTITLVKAKNQSFPLYKPKSWQLRTKFGSLLIAESPQHPSKKNFYEPRIFDKYLANKIETCL